MHSFVSEHLIFHKQKPLIVFYFKNIFVSKDIEEAVKVGSEISFHIPYDSLHFE